MAGQSVTYVKTIAQLERLNNSANGNPRWRVGFTDGTSAVTKPDAGIGYAIDNLEFKGVAVEFKVNEANQIFAAKPLAE